MVAQRIHRELHIDMTRDREGFAVVPGFQCRQLIGVFFNQKGQPLQQAPAVKRAHPLPGFAFEAGLCGLNGQIHILLRARRDLCIDLLGRRVHDVNCLVVLRIPPLTINQKFPCRKARDRKFMLRLGHMRIFHSGRCGN